MDIVKLNAYKYAFRIYYNGKPTLLALNGELLSFDTKKEAEDMKDFILNNIRLSEDRSESTV